MNEHMLAEKMQQVLEEAQAVGDIWIESENGNDIHVWRKPNEFFTHIITSGNRIFLPEHDSRCFGVGFHD